MSKADFRIIFLGTPDFAVASLKKLVEGGWNIVAVVSAPDKARGRGQKKSYSAVKEFALSKEIPVLQPVNLKSNEFLEELNNYKANLQVVVAFRMLPKAVWEMPPLGTFNLHASLLPNYRGAAPINWAIINGEKETGVTTFFLKHEIDTGNIILQEKVTIEAEDNAGSLHDKLMEIGASLVVKTTDAIYNRSYRVSEQKLTGDEKIAPKLSPELCIVNWNDTSVNIHNFIRGLSPYPCAQSVFNGIKYKIFKTEIVNSPSEKPGQIISDQKTFLHISTNDGIISILEIQKEGKRKMGIKEFLAGNRI